MRTSWRIAVRRRSRTPLHAVLNRAHYGVGVPILHEENRHWVGGTLRYQYADFSFSPTLIMYIADDEQMGDTESMLLDVRADYNVGPLSLSGRVVYTPGSDLNPDGTMRTNRDYDVIGVWGIPLATQWFNLFGNTSGSPTFNDLGPLLLGETAQANIRHEHFGLMHVAAKAEYTLTPQTSIGAALGIFNTAEDTMGIPSTASGQFTRAPRRILKLWALPMPVDRTLRPRSTRGCITNSIPTPPFPFSWLTP